MAAGLRAGAAEAGALVLIDGRRIPHTGGTGMGRNSRLIVLACAIAIAGRMPVLPARLDGEASWVAIHSLCLCISKCPFASYILISTSFQSGVPIASPRYSIPLVPRYWIMAPFDLSWTKSAFSYMS